MKITDKYNKVCTKYVQDKSKNIFVNLNEKELLSTTQTERPVAKKMLKILAKPLSNNLKRDQRETTAEQKNLI